MTYKPKNFNISKLFQLLTIAMLSLLLFACERESNPNSVARKTGNGNGSGGFNKPIAGLGLKAHGYSLLSLLSVKHSVRALDIVTGHLNGESKRTVPSCQKLNPAPEKGKTPDTIKVTSKKCGTLDAQETFELTFGSGGYGESGLKTIKTKPSETEHEVIRRQNNSELDSRFAIEDETLEMSHTSGGVFEFTYAAKVSYYRFLGRSRKKDKDGNVVDLTQRFAGVISAKGTIDVDKRTVTLENVNLDDALAEETGGTAASIKFNMELAPLADEKLTNSDLLNSKADASAESDLEFDFSTPRQIVCELPLVRLKGLQEIDLLGDFQPEVLLASRTANDLTVNWQIADQSLPLTCQSADVAYLPNWSDKIFLVIFSRN